MSGWFMRLAIPDKCVKFRDARVFRSPEILPEAIGGGNFHSFFQTSMNVDRKYMVYILSGMAVESVGRDICAKFG